MKLQLVSGCAKCSYHKISHKDCSTQIWCKHPSRKDAIMNHIKPEDFINDILPDWCPRKVVVNTK